MKLLNDVQVGDQIRASSQNALIGNVNQVGKLSANAPLQISWTPAGPILSLSAGTGIYWIGEINSTGKSDFSDARYWVQKTRCTNSDAYSDHFTHAATKIPSSDQVIATNLAEWDSNSDDQTHQLANNDLVMVYEIHDLTSPKKTRYIFTESLGGLHNLLDSDTHLDTQTYTPPSDGMIVVGERLFNSDYSDLSDYADSDHKWIAIVKGEQYQVFQVMSDTAVSDSGYTSDWTTVGFGWVRAH